MEHMQPTMENRLRRSRCQSQLSRLIGCFRISQDVLVCFCVLWTFVKICQNLSIFVNICDLEPSLSCHRTESKLSYEKARTLGDRIESFKRLQTESLTMHRKRSAISAWALTARIEPCQVICHDHVDS